jgi:arylsulfatase A-like enzyme
VLSHPADHLSRSGVDAPGSDVLPSELTTIAEHLTAAGYETAAFVANPWMRADLGFAQGFDVWNDTAAADDAPGTIVVRAALDWLRDRQPERPFFLYIHTMDSHAPYPPLRGETIDAHREALDTDPRRLSPAAQAAILRAVKLQDGRPLTSVGVQPSIRLLKLAYDGGIAQFDAALAELLAGLDARPDASELAVLVTSDHGEALFERGWASHGYGLFDDEIAIPMAARLPGVSGPAVVDCPVGLIDVMTSLCVYLGIECAGPGFGTPFLRVAGQTRTDTSARWIVSEGVIAKPRHRAIRNRDIALLFEPDGRPGRPAKLHPNPFALYTRREGKAHPEPSVPEDLRSALERAVPPFAAPETSRVELDTETRARLEALGYAVPMPAED